MSAVRIVISVSANHRRRTIRNRRSHIIPCDRSLPLFESNCLCADPNDDPSPALLIPSLLLALLVTYKQNDRSSIYLAVEKRLRESLEL